MKQFGSMCVGLALALVAAPRGESQSTQQKPVVSGEISPKLKEAMARREIVASADELKCIDFIAPDLLPKDFYISGTREEGRTTSAMEGSIVYASGPGAKAAKAGAVFRVVRPEGKILDQITRLPIGYYYKELGTIKVSDPGTDTAVGRVEMSCHVMYKGDLLIPPANRQQVRFNQPMSTATTPIPENGLASSILFGKDDLREMASGHFCFISAGARDGVKPGDRFTIFRPQVPFDPKDFLPNPPPSYTTYEKARSPRYEAEMLYQLQQRKLPHYVVGDLVVVDVAETTAAAKIVSSRTEVHPGDLAVRR